MSISRREFGLLTAGAVASLAFGTACEGAPFATVAGDGRLKTRFSSTGVTTARGVSPLNLGGRRDAILQMPSTIAAGPMGLLVLLHGAGGAADRMLSRFGSLPNDASLAILSVDSRGQTWDAIRGEYGPDVDFLDRALEKVFGQVAVDPNRLGIGGFSDGATYGLSLGLINGDLFRRIVAFSPGFIVEGAAHNKPRVFISHGTNDDILPIDRCSRVIVPELRKRGYDVTFREFAGVHEMPPAIQAEGLKFAAS